MILAIYGSGGTGREVLDMVQQNPSLRSKWEKVIFLDDTQPVGVYASQEMYPLEQAVLKYGVENIEIIIAVGEPRIKEILVNKVKLCHGKLATIIHPDAQIAQDAKICEGVIIKKGVVVSSGATVGSNTCIQVYAVVGHDVVIGDNCQISAFVFTGGFSQIGNNTYIAAHVPVKDRVVIGSNSIVGMGSVVLRDIEDGVVAMGNPARTMKKNEDGSIFH